MTPKEKYRLYYPSKNDIPIFFDPAWLDAATNDEWDIILSQNNNGDIVGFMPICLKTKYGFDAAYTPLLTQSSGIWIDQSMVSGDKTVTKQSNKRQIIQDIVNQIKETSYFRVNFHHSFDMWLPFYYKKFKQTTLYTYILEGIKDHEAILNGFKGNIKNKIKKAEHDYKIFESDDIGALYILCSVNFKNQGLKLPFDFSYLKAIDSSKITRKKLFLVKDNEGTIVAGQYLVWDQISAYNLLLAIDENHKNMGVGPKLLWHSIQFASEYVDTYDFEGSMLPQVQPFFESFGGNPVTYYQIYKINNPIMRMWFALIGKI